MAIALEADDVRHQYGGIAALDGVSLSVDANRAVALVGESGAGKTTLLRCFNRMVEPTSGSVRVDGSDVRGQPVASLRRRLGYVPQNGGLLPHWTILRNVALVPTLLRASRREAADAARAALELVGLPAGHFGDRLPYELSGGQRQRVAIARAVAARPGAILLDEPFGSLDAITRADMQAAFAGVRRELGATVLLVTHDLSEAARIADEIVVMRAGRIEQRADVAELRASPATPYVAALFERALASAESLRSA
jgi:osmoprotectant transport system ATP-binding protein